MTSNLLFLVLFSVLTVLFGWLTWRAIRARRLWVKIAGGVGAGVVTLLFAAIALTGGRGVAATYFPGAPAAPNLTVAATPEQIARGEYLVNLSCVGCHSAVGPDGNPTEQQPLTGGWNIAAAEGFGFMGDMIAENLTPGGKLAGYSDGELFRVLRHSVDKGGVKLGFMGFLPYKELSDADTQAIIAYLRSLEPVPTAGVTGDNLNFVGAVLTGSGLFPPSGFGAEMVTAPPAGISVEYGRYVATYGECHGCHGPDASGTEASALGPAIPNPRPLVSTLSQEQFFTMMRSGVKPGGVAFPETMPWRNAAKMTDDDLAALYVYLTAAAE